MLNKETMVPASTSVLEGNCPNPAPLALHLKLVSFSFFLYVPDAFQVASPVLELI